MNIGYYHSKEVEQEIIKRGYIPYIRNRREQEKVSGKKYHTAKILNVEGKNKIITQ